MNVTASADEAGVGTDAHLALEARRFRAELLRSRSTIFVQLFDYLVSRSVDARAPKEIEIAMEVFGKPATFDTSQDSTVRVYVHRLRQRLDAFYVDRTTHRLHIPFGEYRVILAGPEGQARKRSALLRWRSRQSIIIAVSIGVSVLLWTALFRHLDRKAELPALASTAFWQPMTARKKPPTIIVGDNYLFAEAENRKDVRRFIMQADIRSRSELDQHFVGHPDAFYKLYDLDIHYVSAGTTRALWNTLKLVSELFPEDRKPGVIQASKLTEQALHATDAIYIGRLDALGMLEDVLFQASGFDLGKSQMELIDRRSGRRFHWGPSSQDKGAAGEQTRMIRDYGYIATLRDTGGKRILIIAGITDSALLQMTQLVSNEKKIQSISRAAGDAESFEALFEIQARGTRIIEMKLQTARPLGRIQAP